MTQGDAATIIGYVQHKSGTGKLWPVIATPEKDPTYWLSVSDMGRYDLPRSEFNFVKPSPQKDAPLWEDVTQYCVIKEGTCLPNFGPFKHAPALTIVYLDRQYHIETDVFHPAQRKNFKVSIREDMAIIGKGVPNGTQKHRGIVVERRSDTPPVTSAEPLA